APDQRRGSTVGAGNEEISVGDVAAAHGEQPGGAERRENRAVAWIAEDRGEPAAGATARRSLHEARTGGRERGAAGVKKDVERRAPGGGIRDGGRAAIPVDFATAAGKGARRIPVVGITQGVLKVGDRSLNGCGIRPRCGKQYRSRRREAGCHGACG